MNKFLLLLFCLCATTTFAQQKFNTKDLKVTQEELIATIYEKDSTANAFYIYENGYSRFDQNADYNLVTDYEAKLKILNKEGYKNATVKIFLNKSGDRKEKLSDIKATTYTLSNGHIQTTKLIPSQIFTEENERYDEVSFTFPALSPGAVLVYSYTKESPFIFNFETWWFQEDIPKVYSRFETKIPANYNYNIKKIGSTKLYTNDQKLEKECMSFSQRATRADCVHSEYIIKDIPAFIEEDFLTSRYNFMDRIEYELIEVTQLDGYIRKYTKDWKDVDKEIERDESLGRQLKKTSRAEDLLPQAISSQPKSLEKAKEIFNFVKSNYKWNGEYHIFRDVNLKDLLKDKSGNISAINILLHNIYEEQGFKVLPVLSSTRGNGVLTQLFPVLSEFNYLILQLELDGETYLLDASEKYTAFGDIPFRALNSYARLLDFDNESKWIDLEPGGRSSITIQDSIVVHADGTASGRSEQVFSGYNAVKVRNQLDETSQEKIFNEVSNPNEHAKSSHISYKNRELISEPVTVEYDLKNDSQKLSDLIYFNPFSFRFFDKNPFQLKERTYPIDLGYARSYLYAIQITIPENHSIVEIPENQLLKLPENSGSLYFIVQKANESTINVQCRVSLSKASYAPGYYPYLKEFMSNLMTIQNGSFIVIKENS
ncbi:DUF3857 domain-containing protein [Gillisia sp. M10.2A]|uniref:DUF3857 domain-containing protein n=1 Tax=Gillisia lutea TaxID=2909668 RepID=A0ABS9EDK5_9FLAO|nr:DUF3857 domain-containing protein [Gillisia lutea]MCF4100945.1 DUF3857 domain-containing protein [Gillisia lutea]